MTTRQSVLYYEPMNVLEDEGVGTAAKIRFDDFQTISRPYSSPVVSEMFRRLTSTKNAII